MNLSKHFRRTFPWAVTDKFREYVAMIHPFPFDPVEDLYRYAFTDQAWASLRYLREERPEMLNANSHFTFDIGALSFDVYFYDEELPHIHFDITSIPSEKRPAMVQWFKDRVHFKELEERLDARLRALVGEIDGACNTYGQVARVWPALVPFFEDNARDSIIDRKAQSAVYKTIEGYGSVEAFRGEDVCAPTEDDFFAELDYLLVGMSLHGKMEGRAGYPSCKN
jgi:hypothetical protein